MIRPVYLRFDFATGDGHPSPLIFANPGRIIEAWRLEDVRPALAAAEAARSAGAYVAGLVAYEAAPAFDTALRTRPPGDLPLVWFGVFDAPAVLSPTTHDDDHTAVDRSPRAAAWAPDVTREGYDAAIGRIREAIESGDSYQANYTFRLRSRFDVASLRTRYQLLLQDHRPPYAAHLDLGRWQVLSLSPELFFRIQRDTITTRPMKGTSRRGRFDGEDARLAAALQASSKERAENVMIVDLMRNDIGRIANVGSVAVPSLFDIERYPAAFQMTSTVTAQVRGGTTLTEIFTALFPAGSITGAPKTSSMRLLAALESAPRGVYCGAIGYLDPNGDAVFNVAIRTAVVDTTTGAVEYGVGGGITWDSTPGNEYAEALSKAGFVDIPEPFSLVETLRIDHGTCVRLPRHLHRLQASAHYFGFVYDGARAAAVVEAHACLHPTGIRRARLLVTRAGTITVETHPFTPAPLGTPLERVVLARSAVSSDDRFLFHKTTHREVYEQHRATHPDAFDVLLWNERRELTEFTIGNVVLELDGTYWTPPAECGLLAGVFREELVETGAIAERVLSVDDLRRASRAWLINSLREWVPVAIETRG